MVSCIGSNNVKAMYCVPSPFYILLSLLVRVVILWVLVLFFGLSIVYKYSSMKKIDGILMLYINGSNKVGLTMKKQIEKAIRFNCQHSSSPCFSPSIRMDVCWCGTGGSQTNLPQELVSSSSQIFFRLLSLGIVLPQQKLVSVTVNPAEEGTLVVYLIDLTHLNSTII